MRATKLFGSDAAHFLVGGENERERLFDAAEVEFLKGREHTCKETFYVTTAAAIDPAVAHDGMNCLVHSG